MAVQIETQGQLSEFVEVLKRRKWQILVPAALISALGTAFAVIVPKKYAVNTQIELRETVLSSTEEGGTWISKAVQEAHLATFQLKARSRVQEVVRSLDWADYLVLERDQERQPEMKRYLDAIAGDIAVQVPEKRKDDSSRFVNIEYNDTDVDRAVEFLKALRKNWIESVLERDKNQLRNERDTLQSERQKLEKLVGEMNEELTDLRKRYDLSPTQPVGGDRAREEDPLVLRIATREVDLAESNEEIRRLEGLIVEHTKRRDAEPEEIKETLTTPGTTYRKEFAQIETDLIDRKAELARYRPAHTQYKKIQDEIQTLEAKREELKSLETEGETKESFQPNPERKKQQDLIDQYELEKNVLTGRVARLEEDLKSDKEYLRELQDVYKDVSNIQATMMNYRAALEDTTKKYFDKAAQYSILQQPEGNPFTITEDVLKPDKPTKPNPSMIIAFSVVFGLGLGIAVAIVREFSKNCFRGAQDISRVMVIPVLGCVNTIVTRNEARRKAVTRFLFGFSSAVVIGSIFFVTWAWAENPELLSPQVRDAIDSVRRALE